MTDKYQAIRDALAAGLTPGPWNVSKHTDARASLVYDADGFEVARVCYPNRDANARLIAACSPETIAALLAEFDALADTQRAIIEAAERRGYERALAEVASMRADAERYRWLRDRMAVEDMPEEHPTWSRPDEIESLKFDASVDSEMEKQNG